MHILLFVALFYSFFVCVMYFMQRQLIYHPDSGDAGVFSGVETVAVDTADGLKISGFYIPSVDPEGRVMVFFHGNAGHHGHRLVKAQIYHQAGYGVFIAGYRGYGGNDGSPSEPGFYHDARAYIQWLIDVKNIAPRDMIFYGESIGSAVAVQMATEYDVSSLVLEAPFSSLYDLAKARYFFLPVDYLLKDRYMSRDKMTQIKSPLLIFHGHRDLVIPYIYGKRLFEEANEPKQFVDFSMAGHNDLYLHGAAQHVIEFLSGDTVKDQ